MKKTFKFFMMAAIVAAGFTGCSSEETNGPTEIQKADKMGVLELKFVNGAETYADVPAIASEKEVKNVLVSIVHQNGTIKDTVVNASQLTVEKIPLPSGAVTVYVGVNLGNGVFGAPASSNYYTAALPAASRKMLDLRPTSSLSNALDTFKLTYPMFAGINATPTNEGFHMFSSATSGVQAQIIADTETSITVDVKRLVAKVNVKTTLSGTVTEKDIKYNISTMAFAMGQANMSTYYLPNPGNHDPNYTTPMSGSKPNLDAAFRKNFANEFVTRRGATWEISQFKPVTTNFTETNSKYVLENTSDVAAYGASTYACIKVQFEPPFTVTYTAGSLVAPTQVAWSVPSPNNLYVVRNASEVYFFKNESEAIAFRNEVFDVVPLGTPHNVEVELFKDQTCFYWVFTGAADTKQTIRNDYYQLNVTKINSLGYPQGEILDDKKDDVDGDGKLTVTVNIVEWNGVTKDVTLQK
ncbi:hypothetical protein M2459_003479 [Parabacteroides sp. PF5-5]|uniref:Mfa1 family fimbria major subunit n=1 Tax=unclassified Parabacteroides TaxID=2649774 RepID=UPI0024734850|nr:MULTISPECIES: Mfa1 family fimbria major subunit [unclassified Parabacteroides]MDH6306894.1 hypothetical protein [Parabacteroides sp. PH5-39]MDH6317718.1 hypothetical protein [Parabacteroides sp. PF5-13]MDH6321590.1 hypothetical protein [Parabacteroides sp. PH5-13]MDH6325281.1 hypothetical protein [Parabacteroides sp. PH5-8]MDH6328903.1 hypothetical protein [Parabacteroides sp. PH5-41]